MEENKKNEIVSNEEVTDKKTKVKKTVKNSKTKKETKVKKETIQDDTIEKVSLNDYKFPIILLSVIIAVVILMPYAFKGIKKLDEMDLLEKIFNKNDEIPIDSSNNQENSEQTVVKADKSNANAPVLKNGMIPVRYNYIQKKWVKADTSNPSTNSWYNYGNSEWANAILVKEYGTKTRDYYLKAKPDTFINDEDILAFFVWIPRYKYSIAPSTGLQQIEITFEDKSVAKSKGPNYITHPAFTFDNQELDGIWVGKFEVTGNMNGMTILPNSTAIVNQNIANMINNLQGFYGNNYGLNSDDANIKLMKNIEWGAVVYLTNSKYGICKANKCNTMTGYYYDYSSDEGMATSTTGNITGVYSMNNGLMEYVMGNNNGIVGLSGLNNVWMSENKKYYDNYSDGVATDYSRGILGDATNEFAPFNDNVSSWNSSHSVFIDNDNPWFIRDINSSIYSFSNYTGAAHQRVGFRLSLS